MLTLNPAASIDYYLATASDSEGLPLLGSEESWVGYYNTKHDSDPLARPGRWFGKMANDLGLAPGSPVDARTFGNLYFGRTPDGRKPSRNHSVLHIHHGEGVATGGSSRYARSQKPEI